MITPKQGRDLQLLERLRADPHRDRILRELVRRSKELSAQNDPAMYTVNKLLWLMELGEERSDG